MHLSSIDNSANNGGTLIWDQIQSLSVDKYQLVLLNAHLINDCFRLGPLGVGNVVILIGQPAGKNVEDFLVFNWMIFTAYMSSFRLVKCPNNFKYIIHASVTALSWKIIIVYLLNTTYILYILLLDSSSKEPP